MAVTPANAPDEKALKHTGLTQGVVLGDKAYCIKASRKTLLRKGCYDFTITMNPMKAQNRDKDRWLTSCRSPDERVFSKVSKRASYQGIAKNQFQVLIQSLAYHLKRLLSLGIERVEISSYPAIAPSFLRKRRIINQKILFFI